MYHRLRYCYRYDFLISSATANEIVAIATALEEAEVLCTVVSDTGTDVIIPPQALLIKY
jgi:hypothetical protein